MRSAERGLTLPADLVRLKDQRMIAAYRRELRPVAGVGEALARIAQPKSVGTNGPRARAIEALEITGLWNFFDSITTFEDVANGKPSPDIYLKAAERAGCRPERCVVVEDSAAGVAAGVAAGCRVFAFTGTAHDPAVQAAKLLGLGAEFATARMEDIAGMIAVRKRHAAL